MARTARFTQPSVIHHVISQFVDRSWLIRDAEERATYLRLLGIALTGCDWRCVAYALMSSHIHLVLLAGTMPLSSWAMRVHSPFAAWMNKRHGRKGPVFAERPDSPGIRPSDEGRVIAYVHNNPVSAGVVRRARNSTWTSQRAYLGLEERPPWLHVDEGLIRCGFPAERQGFERWVDKQKGIEMPELERGVDTGRVHRAARRHGAIELLTPTLGERTEVPLVRRPFGHIRIDPKVLVEIASMVTGVPEPVLCSRQREALTVSAKHVTVQCAVELGLTGSDIAAALGLSNQAISRFRWKALDPEQRGVRDVVLERARREYLAAFAKTG